ncbi:glycosyltransferase family 2 protein [Terriglobus aquaticus]|nr:glycosyltransferase family A protein [Terriglobus aquaticus]
MDVVMAAYNAARYLPTSIGSVLAQTEPDWHLVLVDDGSTDDTEAVAREYKERLGDRMTYVRQKNGGPSAARNTAIRVSSSPLIAMLDADDVWLPDRLARAVEIFEREPTVGLTYGGITRFREPDVTVDTFYGNSGKAEGYVAERIYTRSMEVPCSSVTIRRKCLESAGMFDETMHATEDRDLWLRIAQRFKVGFVPEVHVRYRMSASSQSADPLRMLQTQRFFVDKHYGEPGCGWRPRQEALARIYRQQAEGFADRKEFGTGLRNALHALTLAPWQTANLRTTASITLRSLRKR